MKNIFEELKQRQKEAVRDGDLELLSAINQKLFEIRERARKRHEIERQKDWEEKTARRIEKFLEREEVGK